jgi:hypothetical protein
MIGNQKHLILGKRDRYLQLQHCRSKNSAPKNFPDIHATSNRWNLTPKRTKFSHVNNARWENLDSYCNQHETVPQAGRILLYLTI